MFIFFWTREIHLETKAVTKIIQGEVKHLSFMKMSLSGEEPYPGLTESTSIESKALKSH